MRKTCQDKFKIWLPWIKNPAIWLGKTTVEQRPSVKNRLLPEGRIRFSTHRLEVDEGRLRSSQLRFHRLLESPHDFNQPQKSGCPILRGTLRRVGCKLPAARPRSRNRHLTLHISVFLLTALNFTRRALKKNSRKPQQKRLSSP